MTRNIFTTIAQLSRQLFICNALFTVLAITCAGAINASPIILTVSVSTDNPNTFPGGQTLSSGSTTGDLRYCINYILNEQAQLNTNDYQIVFAPDVVSIQLQAKLSMVNLLGTDSIVIGNPDPASPVTISGGSGTNGLFIRQGNVTLQNINFQGVNATGGSGGGGGGGGMGAGGALFIDKANVTLHNVNFNSCSATAGLGGANDSNGGGGGLGGNGGSSQGGGGGYGGNGGDDFAGGGGAGGNGGNTYGGGGGAILGTTGGVGGSSPISSATIGAYTFASQPAALFFVGGGGYGSHDNGSGGTGAGANNSGGLGGFDGGNNVGGNGGDGGSPQMSTGMGGDGNTSTTFPASSGMQGFLNGMGGVGGTYESSSGIGSGGGGGGGYSGGGGGGGNGDNSGGGGGGGGGLGGGGGGGFRVMGGAAAAGGGNGGDSSIGGGGGGGGNGGGGGGGGFGLNGLGHGGNGGDGGGGGGSHAGGAGGYGAGAGNGSAGGFGGGGGGLAGPAGFGGGGGSGGTGGFGGGGGIYASSGTGATLDLSIQAGNGAALGGAVFLGSPNGQPILTLTGNCSTTLNTTSNNSGGGYAGGDDFFLYSGTTLNLMPGTGETISISRSIIDDSEQSIPAASTWQPGTGLGANLQVSGTGTVILSGINSYIGTTTLSSGTLKLNGTLYAGGAGNSSQVTINPGSFLKGTGTINAPTIVSGTLSPGNSIGTMFYNAPLTLPGVLNIEIAPTPGNNSQVSSTSTVDVTGATIQIVPDPGTYTAGAQYTLLTSSGLTGTPTLSIPAPFSGELSYPNNSIVLTLLAVSSSSSIPATLNGSSIISPAIVCCGRPVILGDLPISGSGPTTYTVTAHTGNARCVIGSSGGQTYLKMNASNKGSCTIIGTKNGVSSLPFTVVAP